MIWLCHVARSSLAILRQSIAKQAMLFGNRLSLKNESHLGKILSLNLCWRLGKEQSLSVREHFLQSLNIDWQFGDLLLLNSLTAIDGHDRQYFFELHSTVVSRRIFIRSQSLIAR